MLHSSGSTGLVAPAPSAGARSATHLATPASQGAALSSAEALHHDTAPSTIRIQQDASNAHWCFMHAEQAFADPSYRPCFSPQLLRDLQLNLQQTNDAIAQCAADDAAHLAHIVIASDAPVFNLGGELGLFSQLIRARDRDGLLRYARECVATLDLLNTGLSPNAHTIALVAGDALGGGFEAALMCQTIVAESGVPMGFPEVLFGLFPGMGAYSLLSRRVSPRVAEDMMLSGVMYSSDELHRMGIVDVLVPKGEGVRAVHDVIRRNRSIATARLALRRVREAVNPVSLDELTMISEIWVDTALRLGEKSLRRMERLVRAQLRSAGAERALRSLPTWDLMGQEADFDATSRSSAAPRSGGAARRLRDRGLRTAAPIAATGF